MFFLEGGGVSKLLYARVHVHTCKWGYQEYLCKRFMGFFFCFVFFGKMLVIALCCALVLVVFLTKDLCQRKMPFVPDISLMIA